MEEIVIGNSDYTRKEMENGEYSWLTIGTSAKEFIDTIESYESAGYTVTFRTSFFRRIFGMGKYQVVASK